MNTGRGPRISINLIRKKIEMETMTLIAAVFVAVVAVMSNLPMLK
jgi:hypothetical protein